jgi:hypothetical protein
MICLSFSPHAVYIILNFDAIYSMLLYKILYQKQSAPYLFLCCYFCCRHIYPQQTKDTCSEPMFLIHTSIVCMFKNLYSLHFHILEGCYACTVEGNDFNILHQSNIKSYILLLTQSYQSCYGPGVYSVSNRNKYQESSWG